ncbi:unnamed protein product, partial [Mesorhabditis belari]|uniref:Uncharacterized protein n=1 Tax=Mesorhabditis belari TaxID=2138241 RepID=A0AAF3FG30_9BILA
MENNVFFYGQHYTKYLKKNSLRDWLRIVASSKDTYELRNFYINQDEEEDIGDEVKEKNEEISVGSNGERSFVSVRGEEGLRVSCRIREVKRAISWRSHVNWHNGKQDQALQKRISTLLQSKEIEVIVKKCEEYVAIRVMVDENHKVNDQQIQSLILFLVDLIYSTSDLSLRIDEIEMIEFPVYLIGSFYFIVKTTSANSCNIELYSEFVDSILGQWIGIRFDKFKNKEKIEGKEIVDEVKMIPREPPNTFESLIVKTISNLGIEIPNAIENPRVLQETFSKLGIDSIQMAEIEIKLREKFPRIVFGSTLKYNSIQKFGVYLEEMKIENEQKKIEMKGDPVWHSLLAMGTLPITVQQQQILFLGQLKPEEASQFNEYFHFSIDLKDFDEKGMLSAIRRLLIEETVLRTIFIDNRQMILSGTEVFLQNEKFLIDEPKIDPTDDLPIRFFIEKTKFVRVLLVFHHISVDGISLKLLSQRLDSLVNGKQSITNKNRPQFVNFALETSQEMILEKDRSFWRDHLSDHIHNSLPALQGSPKAFYAKYLTWDISESINKAMQFLSNESGISMYKCFVGAHMATFCKDILATSMNNRDKSKVELLPSPPRRPKYDQVWFWQRNDSKYSIKVEFDPKKFSVKVMKWYLDRVGTMIIKMGKAMERKLSSLSPFPRSITQQHQRGLRACLRDHPEKFSWLEIFKRQTRSTGCESKIIDAKETITYEKLDKLSTQISQRIAQRIWQSLGVSPKSDTPIAVFCSQSHRRLLLMIAIWKIRLYPFNINMDWPLLKQKANTALFGNILFLTENSEHLRENSPMTIDLSKLCLRIDERLRKSWVCNSPEDVMYITCTSGTTGAPKCVVTPFRGHNNLPLAYARSFFISHQSVTYQAANYAFDIFFGDLTMSLSHGSNIRIASTGVPALEEMLSSNVSHSYIMPAFLSTLSDSEIGKIGSLERIFFGGEQIQHGVKQKMIHSNAIIYEKYGTSEQTVYSTKYEVKFGGDRGLVGIPYPNLYMASINSENHLTDGRLISECVQFGAGISRGYHSLPERNSTRYSPSQLSTQEDHLTGKSIRSYLTGDLVSLHHKKCYQFHGRRDTQTKIGGKFKKKSRVVRMFIHALQKATSTTDICIGAVLANRTPENFDKVGYFVNIVPMRFTTSHENQNFIKNSFTQIDHILKSKHQETTLSEILESLKIERTNEKHPLFTQVINIRQGLEKVEVEVGGMKVEMDFEEATENPFELSWIFDENAKGELIVNLLFDANRILNEQAEYLLRSFLAEYRRLFRVYQLDESIASYQLLFVAQFLAFAFLSIHPDTPSKKMREISEQCKPFLLIEANERDHLLEFKLRNEKNSAHFAKSTKSDLFYVIYTSGTTGDPKGIAVSEGNVQRMMRNFTKINLVKNSQKTLIFSTPSFDGGIAHILTAPMNGGTICVRWKESHIDELIGEYHFIDSIHCTPTIASSLFNDKDLCLKIGLLNIGGEAFTEGLLKKIGDNQVIQLYGPAEATCYQTFLRMKPNHRYGYLGNSQLEYTKRVTSEVRVNGMNGMNGMNRFEIREFVVRSHQVSRGYIEGRETKAFGRNVYRTGDMGWMDPNGGLHFVGRRDLQCKINGVRVELAEIERAIGKIEGIDEVVVIVEVKEILAFYTANQSIDRQLLQKKLSQLNKEFSLKIPFRQIYKTSTPRDLSEFIDDFEKESVQVETRKNERFVPRDVEGLRKVPENMARLVKMLLRTQNETMKRAYNCPLTFRTKISLEKSMKSFRKILMKHRALRGFFSIEEEEKVKMEIFSGTEAFLLPQIDRKDDILTYENELLLRIFWDKKLRRVDNFDVTFGC